MAFLQKLRELRIWRRILLERLTEPLHLNALAVLVAASGRFRWRVAFDLVLRQHNAFGILRAADLAKAQGLRKICVAEFGVAAGTGLMNMCAVARQVTAVTGVEIELFGFDSGQGMPPALDYRDHPELYQAGDFPMDAPLLRSRLPANAHLVLGDVAQTVGVFLEQQLTPERPLGFVVIDVDYYHSTVAALKVCDGPPELYLPTTLVYLDDIHFESHNPYAGELLAVQEFNAARALRKICRPEFLENSRVFRRANWIKHIFYLHVFDHPRRRATEAVAPRRILPNLYLSSKP